MEHKVNHESMEKFVSEFPGFLAGLEFWIMQRAEQLDVKSLIHFKEIIVIFLDEAIRRIEEGGKYKNFN